MVCVVTLPFQTVSKWHDGLNLICHMDVSGCQGVLYCKVTLNYQY